MSKRFGMTLRAFRMGYHWSTAHRCYVRIEEQGMNRFKVMLAPADNVPCGATKGNHVCWWEQPDVLFHCEPLRVLAEMKSIIDQPVQFWVNDNGDEIDPDAPPPAKPKAMPVDVDWRGNKIAADREMAPGPEVKLA